MDKKLSLIVLLGVSLMLFGCVQPPTPGADVSKETVNQSLGALALPSLNIPSLSIDLGNITSIGFGDISLPLSPSGNIEVNTTIPEATYEISMNASELAPTTPTSQTGTSASNETGQGGQGVDCSQFASAPSCSYVPANVQAQCKVCKGE